MTKRIGVYTIDDNVEIPEVTEGGREYSLPPLSMLNVGESILFPLELRKSVQTTASRIKKADGKEFIVRKVTEAFARVWRIK